MAPPPPPPALAGARWPGELRPYQRSVLKQVDELWAQGRRRTWIVLPPGAGKTLVGLEAARRLGRRTVVFAPNTAIQGQWAAHWHAFERPDGCEAGTDRALQDDVSVLTYQSLAVFDPDAETDEEGREEGRAASTLKERLHANGAALVDALHAAGPLTVLLDECHHLLQAWGRLLDEVLAELDDAYVIGLTGTPAASLTVSESELVDRLFGPPVTGASIPALVRDGYLAPFAELAYVTRCTPVERDYLSEQGARFTEMCTDLLEPGFAETGFLAWVRTRFHDRETEDGARLPWSRIAGQEPDLADAVLRLHYGGLCDLPDGARLLERHRHPPRAEDWTALIGDYARHCLTGSDTDRDRAARERLRSALPAVGYHLTKRGVRRGASPVDRVVARSASKSYATVEIVAAESAATGERLRALVLCDHERATARAPARLRGVLDDDAGSAWLQLDLLVGDERTAGLHPMLVTGRTVAAAPETAEAFIAFAGEHRPGLDLRSEPAGRLCRIEGPWSPRVWVGLVTRFFEEGRCRALVGTRALLGEGWDARGVNTVVDATTATTPTSVVQSRGRALRLDPSWPEKTAHTWTVVCVAEGHPRGAADWERFVRKHEGYLGVDADGEVMSGVAHVDPSFSPFEPPAEEGVDALNARMLARAERREETRRRWNIGRPYRDDLLPTLRVRPNTEPAPGAPPVPALAAEHAVEPPRTLPAERGVVDAGQAPDAWRHKRRALSLPTGGLGAAGLLLLVLAVAGIPGWPLAGAVGAGLVLAAAATQRSTARRRLRAALGRLQAAARPVDTARYACAVADALKALGRPGAGAQDVRISVDADGVYRYTLTDAGPEAAEEFTEALDELLAPLVGSPRYIIPRYVVEVPEDTEGAEAAAKALLQGEPAANRAVYHAVPSAFARNKEDAGAFQRAWNTWVSAGAPLYAASGRGREVLDLHHGTDPADGTTARRMAWA